MTLNEKLLLLLLVPFVALLILAILKPKVFDDSIFYKKSWYGTLMYWVGHIFLLGLGLLMCTSKIWYLFDNIGKGKELTNYEVAITLIGSGIWLGFTLVLSYRHYKARKSHLMA